jgi:hypothetical protein
MDTIMNEDTATDQDIQVKAIFTTSDEDIQLPEGKRQLLVPAGKVNVTITISYSIVLRHSRYQTIWAVPNP